MKKYEAVIILNPNLTSKTDDFIKDFEKLLKSNSFSIQKKEDVGRRQLAYSINNHNKGHYLLFNIEGDASKLIEIENKIRYNESIIRHLFISVKDHSGEDSQLLKDAKNKKNESEERLTEKNNKEELKPSDSTVKTKIQETKVEEIKKNEINDSESKDSIAEQENIEEKEDKDE